MVYERLPRETHHFTIPSEHAEVENLPGVVLISHATSTAILQTCRTVYNEAKPFVEKSIKQWAVERGVKVMVSTMRRDMVSLFLLLAILPELSRNFSGRGLVGDTLDSTMKEPNHNITDRISCNTSPLYEAMMPMAEEVTRWLKRSAFILHSKGSEGVLYSVDIAVVCLEGIESPCISKDSVDFFFQFTKHNMGGDLRNMRLNVTRWIDAGSMMTWQSNTLDKILNYT